ncbi:hydroxyproline dehydrogenase-like [Lytechinus variegatus]|uniref:hydroxyproline dehydrogenase-like n=1 Tax=Lytechinus variegatus TaxID=7654 RepID=UPI001BB1D9F6|nr:hydroxyproline dehydrogenase-like [Lytechinus variegatus]
MIRARNSLIRATGRTYSSVNLNRCLSHQFYYHHHWQQDVTGRSRNCGAGGGAGGVLGTSSRQDNSGSSPAFCALRLRSSPSYRQYSSGRLMNGFIEDDLLKKEILVQGADGKSPPVIDFSKAEIIFKQKATEELARSLVVLQMCSFNFFVDNSLKLMSLGLRVLGDTLFSALMRASFYGQFAASPQSVTQVAKKFSDADIAPMLATTAEEKVGDNPDTINEAKYDRNVETMLLCLDMQLEVARPNQPILSQLRVTSYIKADLLAKLSDILATMDNNFLMDSPVCVANFKNGLDGNLMDIPELTDAELIHLRNALKRMDVVLQRAIKNGIKTLVDAEYVSVNQAMSLITLAMMKKYNSKEPLVWNTYQCYLKEAMANMKKGLEVADAEGFKFGVKVVRGAYMEYERTTARLEGKPDPVNATYEYTNNMYNDVVAHLLERIHERGSNSINLIIATHNIDSVSKAMKRMWELGLAPREGSVVFGQLMGMCDHVSYGLGQAGYLTYKSIPFGSIEDVLANMSRRAQENKTVFHRLEQEKKMLRKEISRRTFSFANK